MPAKIFEGGLHSAPPSTVGPENKQDEFRRISVNQLTCEYNRLSWEVAQYQPVYQFINQYTSEVVINFLFQIQILIFFLGLTCKTEFGTRRDGILKRTWRSKSIHI